MTNPDRVKQAREFRGLSQKELADRLAVSQSTIAYIENGRFTPSETLLNSIALQTGFPTSFFRDPNSVHFPLGSLLYRSRASATAAERTLAHRYGEIAFILISHFLAKVKPLKVKIGPLEGDPKAAARATRSNLGLSPDRPISALSNLLEAAGVLVLSLPVQLDNIDAFSLWAGPRSDLPVIVVSSGKPTDRLRFNIAHELGHLVLHQTVKGNLERLEKDAHAFAAELLMPETAMRQELVPPISLTQLSGLKVRWGVSMQALARRAYDLQLVTERQYRYIFQQLSARGWRINEPGSDLIAVEEPRAMRQLVEMFYGKPVDFKKIATETHIPRPLVESFVGPVGSATAPLKETGRLVQFPRTVVGDSESIG